MKEDWVINYDNYNGRCKCEWAEGRSQKETEYLSKVWVGLDNVAVRWRFEHWAQGGRALPAAFHDIRNESSLATSKGLRACCNNNGWTNLYK